ncbi:MAG: hypothetical protein PHE60_00530 [Sulfurospirillaceae bacterium]|nr:hypothetical protein [Sulfurospirillaceae bacterium]
MKKTEVYSVINNYIFDYLTTFSRKNLYLIVNSGKVVIESEGFNFCRKLKEENRLKDFNSKDLKNIIEKIYLYIIQNQKELFEKYGNGGRYKNKVLNCKTLKQKQKISGETTAKINSQKKQNLVVKTIENLLKTQQKITIKAICSVSKLDNKTVIKYYQNLKNEIKLHNSKIKIFNKEIDKFLKELF